MTIATPVQLGSASAAAGSSTLTLTTLADSPAGATIVVFAGDSLAVNVNSVTDSAGNTYAAGTQFFGTSGKARPFHRLNAAHLPAGGAITVTFNTTAAAKLMGAVSVGGLAAPDVEGAGATGTGAAPSAATGPLGWPSEIVFGLAIVAGGAGDGFTESAGFTSNTAALNGAALRWAWRIVSTGASVTYAPTLAVSRTWATNVKSFSAIADAAFDRAGQFTYLEF